MKIDINTSYCCTLWFPVLFFIPWIPSAAFTGSSLITRQGELNKVALKGSHLELPCSTETFTSYDALFQWRKDGSLLISSRNSLIKPQHEVDEKPHQQVPSPGLPVKTFLTTSDHRISISSINGSLKINNVTYKDEGLYLCEAFNYFETTLLKITLYVIEPHPRHHRYHSHVQRPYHSQEETPVAYLPILSLSLVISFFLIINCYKKESSPHIPDLTETSRLSSFFSRTCKGHQSFLLTKATTATLPTTSLPLINSSKAEGNNVETNSDNNNTRVKHFEANFEVKKLTSSLTGDCEANSICPQNVYMNGNECQYEQVQNEIDPSQRVLQSTRHYQPQSLLPCQYQHDYHCYQQCQPRYLANCESESTVKSPSSRLTSSLSEPSLSTHKAMESSASPLEATPSNDNHHHRHYSTSEIFINFCSKMDSLHSDSPPLAPAIASKSFWSESVKTKCSSTCLSDRSIISDSDLDSNNNNNINSCNVDNNFINSSNRKMTNITRNPVCLGYKINEKFINCVDESFFERESTHSSGPSSPTSLSSSLTSSNSLVPNSSSSPSFSYGQTNNIFSKQSDHLKPRITYFDSIVVYRSDSGDISDFISSFVS